MRSELLEILKMSNDQRIEKVISTLRESDARDLLKDPANFSHLQHKKFEWSDQKGGLVENPNLLSKNNAHKL